MIETLDCPVCQGRGEFYYICENRMVPCPPCGATGKVQRDRGWVDQGERLRLFRRQGDLTLREASKRAGVSVVVWSDAERGRTDPAPIFAALEARS